MTSNYVLKNELLYKILRCPKTLRIPTNDFQAYSHPEFRSHRWVYNKLQIAESQQIACGPIGVRPSPDVFPVIVKPIINLFGMGFHAYKFDTWDEYRRDSRGVLSLPGLFWSRFFHGRHLSIDLFLRDGRIIWTAAFRGQQCPEGNIGRFDHWMSLSGFRRQSIARSVRRWIRRHLKTYTGCLNLETIGDHIIECHLRMGDINQLPNARRIFRQIIRLYSGRCLSSLSSDVRVYLIPVFLSFDEYQRARPVSQEDLFRICNRWLIRTVQIDPGPSKVTYPTSGIRVFLLTCDNLHRGRRCRAEIRRNLLG
jgi:hypothetical protein